MVNYSKRIIIVREADLSKKKTRQILSVKCGDNWYVHKCHFFPLEKRRPSKLGCWFPQEKHFFLKKHGNRRCFVEF